MTNQTTYDDPFAAANTPPILSNDLWGQVTINAWFCVLEKGYGRVPFDPAHNNANERRTAIDVTIEPLPELGITNPNVCERRMLAESKEWRTITLASLRDLGFQDVRAVNGKWAHILPEPTGRTYEKNGEVKNETTFKFVALYDTEAACRQAYFSAGGKASDTPQPMDNGAKSERDTAKPFLSVIISGAIAGKQPDQYRDAVTLALANFPLVAKYFTYDSPEVQELLPSS